jgi:hypothetical protein
LQFVHNGSLATFDRKAEVPRRDPTLVQVFPSGLHLLHCRCNVFARGPFREVFGVNWTARQNADRYPRHQASYSRNLYLKNGVRHFCRLVVFPRPEANQFLFAHCSSAFLTPDYDCRLLEYCARVHRSTFRQLMLDGLHAAIAFEPIHLLTTAADRIVNDTASLSEIAAHSSPAFFSASFAAFTKRRFSAFNSVASPNQWWVLIPQKEDLLHLFRADERTDVIQVLLCPFGKRSIRFGVGGRKAPGDTAA